MPPPPAVRAPQTLPAHRVVDPTSGVTWGELAAYYASVSELMLGQLRERPVTLVRALAGVAGSLQAQAHAGSPAIRDIGTLAPGLDPGQPPLLEIRAATGLKSAIEAGTVELHTWNSTVRAIRKPDRIVLRLESGPGAGWTLLRDGAASVRSVLAELGLKSFLKTSGATGLHVLVPLMPSRGWEFVEQFAQALVAHLIGALPGRFADARGPGLGHASVGAEANDGSSAPRSRKRVAADRVGTVLIDGRCNGWGATAVCAWSARARPGLGISVPVAWDELDELTSGAHWTVRDAARRIAVGNRPWEHFAASRQGLATAVKALGFEVREQPSRSETGDSGGPPMWMHDTPPAPETPPPPGPPPTPVTPDGDPVQPVSDPLAPGHPEPVREPPMTHPPAAL